MKKAFCLLILLTFFLFPLIVEARGGVHILTYIQDNSSGVYLVTSISTSTIIPDKHKILGFSVQALDGTQSAERVVALHDAISGHLDSTFMGEAESIENSFNGLWYPSPRELVYGLTVNQGPNTRVIIYYSL